MKFARAAGWLNTRILLTIVFFFVIGIPAVVMKLLRRDPLDRRFRDRESYWKERLHEAQSLEAGRHQF